MHWCLRTKEITELSIHGMAQCTIKSTTVPDVEQSWRISKHFIKSVWYHTGTEKQISATERVQKLQDCTGQLMMYCEERVVSANISGANRKMCPRNRTQITDGKRKRWINWILLKLGNCFYQNIPISQRMRGHSIKPVTKLKNFSMYISYKRLIWNV